MPKRKIIITLSERFQNMKVVVMVVKSLSPCGQNVIVIIILSKRCQNVVLVSMLSKVMNVAKMLSKRCQNVIAEIT